MCSIIVINGKTSENEVYSMLDALKHRGPDGYGLYFNKQIYHNQKTNIDSNEDNLVLAHNLLSIVGDNNLQPLSLDNLTLISNAELYNYEELIEKYNLSNLKTDSDCEVILKLIDYYYDGDLKSAVISCLNQLDGDYVFCVYDESDYMVVRDRVGVKPLYYTGQEDKFICASEKKALEDYSDIKSLNPRYAIYNDKLLRVFDDYNRCENIDDYENTVESLKDALINSVKKRTKGLDHVALLFSGGVDSSIIASILKTLDVDFTAYSVGSPNSQDLNIAKKVAKHMDFELKYIIISQEDVEEYFIPTVNAIEDRNLMKIGVGMTINMASHLASLDGHKVILSGQGADELFAGYNRYKNSFDTPDTLLEELTHDLNNMYHVNLERDDKATMSNSIELRVPFLDRKVIDIASRIPIKYMIKSSEDNIRKHILRDTAYQIGVCEQIAYRPKKAAQYGSGIDKIIRKKLLKQDKYQKILSSN